jgi:hypothetical protein
MLARTELDPQEALVCTMVLVAAAETQGISDREIGVMATLVQTLPAFEGFAQDQLQHAIDATIGLLRETAYTLACDVVAADRVHGQAILQMLEFIGAELRLDTLVVSAIERATRARYQRVEKH